MKDVMYFILDKDEKKQRQLIKFLESRKFSFWHKDALFNTLKNEIVYCIHLYKYTDDTHYDWGWNGDPYPEWDRLYTPMDIFKEYKGTLKETITLNKRRKNG